MRLLFACLVLLLAPAGALIVTQRAISGLEGDFGADGRNRVMQLERVVAMYPPKAQKMRAAPAIQSLQGLDDAMVTRRACHDRGYYSRLFERIEVRCDQWSMFNRVRTSTFVGVLLAIAALATTLMTRIGVERAVRRQRWPGDWTAWFAFRGLPAMLVLQVLLSMVAYGAFLQTITGSFAFTAGVLLLPAALLVWLERKVVMSYVSPQQINAFRPARVRVHARLKPGYHS